MTTTERLVLSDLTPYAGTFGTPELLHLLKRTQFGVSAADLNTFKGKSLTEVLNTLLTATTVPTPPINAYNDTNNIDPDVPSGQTWVSAAESPNFGFRRRLSLKAWWLGLMLNPVNSIHEKMVLFWHNHFATEINGESPHLGYIHQKMLRENALGNFKTLTKLVTIDPLMLRYLNGYQNEKNAPDENYGRELQELFTVGKGENVTYTENDVKLAAKVLTGYRIDNATRTYFFNSNKHDTTNKKFSTFYKNTTITGRTGTDGEKELDDMLTMIFASNEVAMHLCRKLYRFFCYYKIDTTVEQNVITPLAATLRANNYDILPVLRQLFLSEHFFDAANRACVIKSPVDYIVGMMRAMKVTFPTPTLYYTEQYKAWNFLSQNSTYGLLGLEQELCNPPSVAGWAAYHQEPSFHEYWITTDTYPKRLRLVDLMSTKNGFNLGNSLKLVFEPTETTKQYADAGDPNKLIDWAVSLLYSIEVTARFKASLKTILLSGQTQDYYWSDAWASYLADPSTANFNIVYPRLTAFYKLILTQPEYQLS